jgi:2-keto-4-pentenoate hydratase/2-oxohepta-3-ene-1,7-dioic acid hydratase in catechol pathway
MGVHVARYESNGMIAWGARVGDALAPIPGEYHRLADLLREGREAAARAVESPERIALNNVRLLSPVTTPCSIVSQGLNYADHRAESGMSTARPPFNTIFMKADSSITGPHDDVIRPKHVRLLDYEIELGLVIGREIDGPARVTNDNLHEFVAGLVITNDVSARDVQIPQQQWFKGKSYRSFCPVGPFLYLLSSGEGRRALDLDVRLEVNGKVRQQSNTRHLIFGPAETLTELSGLMTLRPGDLIQTGTPGGVAIRAPSPLVQKLGQLLLSPQKQMKAFISGQLKGPDYLRDGDVMRLTIRSADGSIDLGVMETRVVPAN